MSSRTRMMMRLNLGKVCGERRRRRWLSSGSDEGKRIAAVWGNGDYGRLGLGTLDSQWKPTPLHFTAFDGESLDSVVCGGAHTLFLTRTRRLFATGLNDFGQLGLGATSVDTNYSIKPLEVSGIDKEILQISAGYYHSCAVTADGELYMWGNNSNGQLGLGKRAPKVVSVPTKVECLDGITIKMAALGSEHSVAVTDGGESLSWGGGSGRLGHCHESGILGFFKSTTCEYTPRLIKKLEGTKVKKVAAGLLHSACIDENGFVFIFGERAVDKVGSGRGSYATTPSMISNLPRSVEVACGGYHTCVLKKLSTAVYEHSVWDRYIINQGWSIKDDCFIHNMRHSTQLTTICKDLYLI